MNPIHRTEVPSRKKIARGPWLLALLALTGGAIASCSSGATCGAGTAFDEATNQCIPTGDLNVIVGDFKLGKFKFTSVDVPERLTADTVDTRSLTITSEDSIDRSLVTVRVAIVPVQETIEELRDILDAVDDDGILGTVPVGVMVIENLKAGESRIVQMDYLVPNSVVDGLYGLYFAVDEVPLTMTDSGAVIVDPAAPPVLTEESRLDDAALVYAPATVIVGVPDKPNLRLLNASLGNSSFELDFSADNANPLFSVAASMSAQGRDVTEPVTANFELALPGHVVDVPGKDLGREAFASDASFAAAPATTTYKYDAARKFKLLVSGPEGLEAEKLYENTCIAGTTDELTACATIFTETGLGDQYELNLSPRDTRLLERTRSLASLNPGLDDKGELKGTLTLTIATTQPEYQGNLADNSLSLPVIFMSPKPAAAASANDADDEGDKDSPNIQWKTQGPYDKEKISDRAAGH